VVVQAGATEAVQAGDSTVVLQAAGAPPPTALVLPQLALPVERLELAAGAHGASACILPLLL